MKIKLVFDDWRNKEGRSIYNRDERLSVTDFHGGSTFGGEIKLDAEQEAEFREYLEAGYRPVFWVMCE